MMKIIIFIIYFVFFNLSTTQSIAYVDKLTDKQKKLITSYWDCSNERYGKYFYSLKFNLVDIPDDPKELQCELKYSKLTVGIPLQQLSNYTNGLMLKSITK